MCFLFPQSWLIRSAEQYSDSIEEILESVAGLHLFWQIGDFRNLVGLRLPEFSQMKADLWDPS
jgi:hypothetical protein